MMEILSIAAAVVVAVLAAFGAGRFSGNRRARKLAEEIRARTHRDMREYERDAENQDDDALAERITRRGL